MFGATQMPFHGKKNDIMFKHCISVSSVEKEGREPGLDPNAGLTAARINLIFDMHTHI